MTAIRLISAIHALWGLSILLMPHLPRPFGGLEPFLPYLSETNVGVLFLASALAPIIVALCKPPLIGPGRRWCAISVLPQEGILFWGVYWNFVQYLEFGFDARLWLSHCYFLVFAAAHTFEAMNIWWLSEGHHVRRRR